MYLRDPGRRQYTTLQPAVVRESMSIYTPSTTPIDVDIGGRGDIGDRSMRMEI